MHMNSGTVIGQREGHERVVRVAGRSSSEGCTYLWQSSSGRWRRRRGSQGRRGRGRRRWDWHDDPSDVCRNTHNYNAFQFVLPAGSEVVSLALTTIKKQEGAPSREIRHTTPPRPHLLSQMPSGRRTMELLCEGEQTSTLQSLSEETPQERATACTHCPLPRNWRVRHISPFCHKAQQLSRNSS